MYKRLVLAIVVFASGCSFLSLVDAQQEQPVLWAGLSINRPSFRESWTKDLQIFFTVVNDGNRITNPEIEETRIIVNGEEIKETGMPIFRNGPRPNNINALQPGDSIELGFGLGEYFKKAGTYTVSFKGVAFETPPIVFRVLPKEVQRNSVHALNTNSQ